jgi:hypothetical protein
VWNPPERGVATIWDVKAAVAGIDPTVNRALADIVRAVDDGHTWATPVVEHARALNKVARHGRRFAGRPTTLSPGALLALKVPVETIAALPVATTTARGESVDLVDLWDAEDRARANEKAKRSDAGDGDDGPLYTDIGALLSDGVPPAPTPDILRRTDGVGLFYRNEINQLYGDPEDGKTMIALAACTEVLRDGGTALFIDLDDNGVASIVSRLLMLHAPVEALHAGRFRYCSPAGPDRLEEAIKDSVGGTGAPDIVVIDCVGELVPMFGGNNNDSDDFTRIIRITAGPLARAGAAVVLIDHMAKSNDSRNYGAGGTMAKRRRVGGTQLRVDVEVPLRKGQGGTLQLSIRKDRHSGLRQHCHPAPEGKNALQRAGRFIINPGDTDWCVTVNPMVVRAPGSSMRGDEKHLRYIEAARGLDDGWTITDLSKRVHGDGVTDAQRRETDRAVKDLITVAPPMVEKLTEGAQFKPATHRLAVDS